MLGTLKPCMRIYKVKYNIANEYLTILYIYINSSFEEKQTNYQF